jgi:homoserine O-acetyltransferase
MNIVFAFCLVLTFTAGAAEYPPPVEADHFISNFAFRSGEKLPRLKIHYRTIGTVRTNSAGQVTNAVLVLHGTTGNGSNFLRPEFAGVLFVPGGALDAKNYFMVLPDGIGHGQSSRPSEGVRAHFPRYGYQDMIEAQYRLLTDGLRVNHLRLVMGTSMGGMHTWLWGEIHPEFMDALLPLASLPVQISGRNRVWRRMIIDAITNDPAWKSGDYEQQPPGLRSALEVLYFMGSNPVRRQREAPTLARADEALNNSLAGSAKTADANNILYALRASEDYDPQPGLEKISAPLLAINFADDLINPPELGILESEIHHVPHGRAMVFPMSDRTNGHGTHTLAAVWEDKLRDLLEKCPVR